VQEGLTDLLSAGLKLNIVQHFVRGVAPLGNKVQDRLTVLLSE
jgi:hypothetical protein